MSIEWGNPNWGTTGHNVHESETASWLEREDNATGNDEGSES